jgi:hypothetical protein
VVVFAFSQTNDLFLDSDKEHAESASPVITPKRPVYIRNGNEPVRRPLGNNFILINGRVFMNYQSPMDPEKIPGRDYLQKSEKLQIEALARFIAGDKQNVMGIVRRVNGYVASSLRYYRNSMPRMPSQIASE